MERIVLVKNNKGGVGKSWLALQLAAYQAYRGNLVLILTSDSQNNIFNFAGHKKPEKSKMKGLENAIRGENPVFYELKENLYFLPLKGSHLKSTDKENFKKYITVLKQEFNWGYIVIDGSPVMYLDNEFMEVADDIIIPTFLDSITTDSVLSMLKNVDFNKVRAIIPNRAGRTKLEKLYYENLKNNLKGSGILLTIPIAQSSVIGRLIEKGKTVFESKSKHLDFMKSIFRDVWDVIEDE
ncbi:ParA family protein [Fusobacterium necrophorum]|uniref:ParA family protein n=1 Tax=Fusobacterium necrophorum TaxID=859 RepID=UPI0007893AF7|nr:ParA family protein [Fusobacterium necrophorum]KYM45705.1 ATPase [Fusobacterium necrophorum subsp. funduliforme]